MQRIVQKIGYPTKSPNVLDPQAIQRYYDDVRITNTTYFGNALAIAEFKSRREWAKLGKPTDRDEWLMTAVTVNVSTLIYLFWDRRIVASIWWLLVVSLLRLSIGLIVFDYLEAV